MTVFTAELEQVFDVAPSQETGLVIDTFDGAGFGGDPRVTHTSADALFSICHTSADAVPNCGVCRAPVQA